MRVVCETYYNLRKALKIKLQIKLYDFVHRTQLVEQAAELKKLSKLQLFKNEIIKVAMPPGIQRSLTIR